MKLKYEKINKDNIIIASKIQYQIFPNACAYAYYLENIDHVNYYVPVTRYVNDSRDKVKIIVDNLTTRYIYEPNLISPLKNTTTLKEYNIEENVMFLDFDQNIYSDKQVLKEEVLNLVSYSIFDNYDIESIVLSVEGKNIKQIKRSEL